MNASPMATGKLNGATSDNCAGRPARQQAQVSNVEVIEGNDCPATIKVGMRDNQDGNLVAELSA